MMFFPNDKVFFEIGIFNITYYALFIMIGGLLACYFGGKEFKRCGYGLNEVEDVFIGCLTFGIIGARLWYCVFYDFEYYFLEDPIALFKIYNGGLAIQGGIVAATIFLLIYCRNRKIDPIRIADAFLPHILLSQAIGRWGNFMNQEAFGGIVSESFYKGWPKFIADKMFIDGYYRMPTFLFESIGNLIGWILIYFVLSKNKYRKRGDMIYAYLTWYGVVRFFVEGLRTDSLMFGPIRMAQLTSIVFIIIGLLGFAGLFRKLFPSKKPVVLFDLDGTLLDTEKAIIETYRQLFIKYSKEELFDERKQLEVLGPPLKKMFPIYFPDQDVDELIKEYRKINLELHKEFVKPMNNAEYILKYLKEAGYKVGIVSTKLEHSCKYGLEITKLDKYIDVLIGEDMLNGKGKPKPDGLFMACSMLNEGHDSLIYIGDSVTDILAGKNAGCYTIGYIFNENRKQILIDSKPNDIISDLKEIEQILERNIEWTYNTK